MLEDRGPRLGLAALRRAVAQLLAREGTTGRLLAEEKLRWRRVYRLSFEIDGRARSFVVKRLAPKRSQRERLVVTRWLPSVGLTHNGPPLLRVVDEETGTCFWHVYEDLGIPPVSTAWSSAQLLRVVETVVQIHRRFEEHPLLGECRAFGRDYGLAFYSSSVRDAIRAVEAIETAGSGTSATCNRLLSQLYPMLDEESERVGLLSELAGPETLLHGDLWTTNILVLERPSGVRIRLIDWDRSGVGPAMYDLSTLLLRFPARMRAGILERYREAGGFVAGDLAELDRNLHTAECARLASCAVGAAVLVQETGAVRWATEELEEVADWFDALGPVVLMPAGA